MYGKRQEKRIEKLFDELPLLCQADIEFFSTPKQVAADSTGSAPESVRVTLSFAEFAPRPAAELCMVGQYVTKVSSNLGTDAPTDLYWQELQACAEGDYAGVGPEFLCLVTQAPTKATRTYRGRLHECPSGWGLYTPYEGRGGEGYYGPLAAFALIRTVRFGLGSNAAYLDQILAELCRLERSGAYNRIDQFESMVVPHQVMQALGPPVTRVNNLPGHYT